MSDNIEHLLKQQGESFDAFKNTMKEIDVEVKKLGSADGLLTERLAKIETSLDKSVEAKAAIEAAIAAEKKEREELEAKLGRMNLSGHSEESAKREVEIKSFNDTLASVSAGRNRGFQPLDGKSYDEYKSALDHYFREGKENLNADEVKTLSVGSDPDGGYFVTPDMTGRMVKKVYESSPVRQNASVQNITTDALEGIEDLGEAGADYAGEQAVSGNTTTPQVGKWRIGVHWIDTEPKATQQLLDDAAVDVEGWLAGKVADKFARFENSEFINGAAARIRGFVLGYTQTEDTGSVTWGEIGFKKTGVSADFAATQSAIDNLIDIVGLLKNEYLGNAKFYTRRSVITKMRKFKDSTGMPIWAPSFAAGLPETVLGYPVVRMEDMPAIAASSYSLAFGDLKQAYQIVDRQGIRVLRDPYTSKPFIKFYTTKRTGGGVVNFEAIKLLKFIN
jgi:HK97 family phage major capsid protein